MRGFIGAVAGALVLFAFAASAHAVTNCNPGSFAGNWRVVSDGQVCTVSIARNGSISGRCQGGGGGNARGRITINRDCKLGGRVNGFSIEGRAWSSTSRRPDVALLNISDDTKLYMAYRR